MIPFCKAFDLCEMEFLFAYNPYTDVGISYFVREKSHFCTACSGFCQPILFIPNEVQFIQCGYSCYLLPNYLMDKQMYCLKI